MEEAAVCSLNGSCIPFTCSGPTPCEQVFVTSQDTGTVFTSIPNTTVIAVPAESTVAFPPPAKEHPAMEVIGAVVVLVILFVGICTIVFGIVSGVFAVNNFIHECNETRKMLDEHIDLDGK